MNQGSPSARTRAPPRTYIKQLGADRDDPFHYLAYQFATRGYPLRPATPHSHSNTAPTISSNVKDTSEDNTKTLKPAITVTSPDQVEPPLNRSPSYYIRNVNTPIFNEQQKFFNFAADTPNENSEYDEEKHKTDQNKESVPLPFLQTQEPSAKNNSSESTAPKRTDKVDNLNVRVEPPTNQPWLCDTCTYQNDFYRPRCEVCGIDRSGSIVKSDDDQATVNSSSGGAEMDALSPHDLIPTDYNFLPITPDLNATMEDNNMDVVHVELGQTMIDSLKDKRNSKKDLQIGSQDIQGRKLFPASSHQQSNKKWSCGTCNYAENPLDKPVCQVCGAVPSEGPPSPEIVLNIPKDQVNKNINDNYELDKSPNTKNQIQSPDGKSEEMVDPLEIAPRNSITNLEIINADQVLRTKTAPSSELPNDNTPDTSTILSPQSEPDKHDYTVMDALRDLGKNKSADTNKTEKNANAGAWKWGDFWQRIVGGTVSKPAEEDLSPSVNSFTRSRSTSERQLNNKNKLRDRTNAKDDSEMSETDWDSKYSVAQLPVKDAEKISRRLLKLDTKKALQMELEKSVQKLEITLQQHAQQIMKLEQRINSLKEQMSADIQKWDLWHIVDLQDICNDYYANTISYYEERIGVEKLHTICFKEKLNTLKAALKTIRANRRWDIEEVRQHVEAAFHTAWKIRLSIDVPDRQQKVFLLKQVKDTYKQEYDRQKIILGKKEISFEERQEKIVTFLQSKLTQYELQKAQKSKDLNKSNKDSHYYHEYEMNEQKTFDSFVLDQRTKEGRITVRWLKWIVQKQEEVTLESLGDFMVKLSHTFIDSYKLPKSHYYDCVRIFVYHCVLGQPSTQDIISNIMVTHFQELNGLDDTYRQNILWMRTLKYDQLQINKEYWFVFDYDLPEKNNHDLSTILAEEEIQKQKDQLKRAKGPFADAINMIGELENNEIHKSPDKGITLVLETIKLINDMAMIYFENNKKLKGEEITEILPLGNDDLFPIVVYCVIQSRMERPHERIRYIELILPEENITMGKAAFSLSVLKAAVQYIVDAAPEEFELSHNHGI